jgi:uncharacterized membrane protein YdjX (TVP38/TMEM64 family)
MIPEPIAMSNEIPIAQTANKTHVGKVVIAATVVSIMAAFFYLDLGRYLSLETLKQHRDQLLLFTDTHYAASILLFIVTYIVVAGLALPGAVILTLAGGFLFGSVLGTVFVNLGATTGAVLAFLASRYLLHDAVEQKFGKWLGPFQEGFAKNGFSYLLTLRLIPLFPFFVVNLVSGLTRVNVGTYAGATAIGIIPGSFVYAYAGRQLGSINSLKEIASPNVIGAFVLLGLFALIPIVYKKFTAKPS